MKLNKETAIILGLSEPEVKILRTIRPGISIADLSIETGIPRTSLYYMLPKLVERGFLYKKKVNKKEVWFEADSKDVANLYRRITDSIDSPTPQRNVPEIKIYSGAKNLLNVFLEISELPKNKRFYGIQPKSSLIEAVNNSKIDDMIHFNEKIKAKKLIIEGIIHEKGTEEMVKVLPQKDQKKFLESFFGRAADTVKLPENFLEETKAEVYYYQDKVAIMNWHKEFAVVIENKDVFELFIEMFKSTKYMLEKYDQNEKIARMLVDE